jgi:hypothetical protein
MELTDSAIMEKGTLVLLKELGYSGFSKYLQMRSKGNHDYMKIQDEIYKGQTIDEIYEGAKQNWEESKQDV